MVQHVPGAYGRHTAADYDDLAERLAPDTDAAVATLAALAGDGPVLELGIGTGRLALPLAGRGLEVVDVEVSEEMVALLRGKPVGDAIPVILGDFEFTLVVLAHNTIFALPSQDAGGVLRQLAAHLRAGGRFVLDAGVPDVAAFSDGRSVRPLAVDADEVFLETATIDPVAQRMTTTEVRLRDGDVRLFPANHRYAWPAELDLMARLASRRLEARWGSWEREPFGAASSRHVSVYVR
jgi:SAM-dependent methyltransferase